MGTGWVGLERLMTDAEVAEQLRVSRYTVQEARRAGRLRGTPVGRHRNLFHPSDVADYINRQRAVKEHP